MSGSNIGKKKKLIPPPDFIPTLPPDIRPINLSDEEDVVTRLVHAPVFSVPGSYTEPRFCNSANPPPEVISVSNGSKSCILSTQNATDDSSNDSIQSSRYRQKNASDFKQLEQEKDAIDLPLCREEDATAWKQFEQEKKGKKDTFDAINTPGYRQEDALAWEQLEQKKKGNSDTFEARNLPRYRQEDAAAWKQLEQEKNGNKDTFNGKKDESVVISISDISKTSISTEAEELSNVALDDNTEEVRRLLDAGVNANANAADDCGATALHYACWKGNKAAILLLLERGASVHIIDEHGKTPLHEACANGKDAIVKLLLDRGAHMNVADNDGKTPLYEACLNGKGTVAQMLLSRNADVFAATSNGRTPLTVAKIHGHTKLVSMLEKAQERAIQQREQQLRNSAAYGNEVEVCHLLGAGVNVNSIDKSGSAALHYATRKGHDMVVQLLLNKGANVNAQNHIGWTALHIACMYGYAAIAKKLLERGAKIGVTNNKGKTPTMVAENYGHDNLVSRLRNLRDRANRQTVVEESGNDTNKESKMILGASSSFVTDSKAAIANMHYGSPPQFSTKTFNTRVALDAEIHKWQKVIESADGSYSDEIFARALMAEERLKMLLPLCDKEEFTPASELHTRIADLKLQIDQAVTLREKHSLAKRLRKVSERYQDEIRAKHSISEEIGGGLPLQSFANKSSGGEQSFDERSLNERRDCLVVFQAAPLVWVDVDGICHPLLPPDFETEKHDLIEAVDEAEALGLGKIDLVFEEATTKRLGAFLATGRSSVLHFSCHGHPEYLAIENKGALHQLHVNKLKGFISAGKGRLKMVFVSACHSRPAGEAFLAAGVDHVVCCKTEESLRDTAAAVFVQNFYIALACGYHLSAAFELARQAVLVSPTVEESSAEMDKFLLLPERPEGNSYHDVPVFYTSPIHRGSAAKKAVVRHSIPSAPELLIGREVAIYRILKGLANARVVTVEGPDGMGKSTVAKATLTYVSERSRTFSFTKYCWIPNVHSLLDNVSRELNYLYEMCKRNSDHTDNSMDSEEFKERCGKLAMWLYKERALVVIDAREMITDVGLTNLGVFLEDILFVTRHTRFIAVCPAGRTVSIGASYNAACVFIEPLGVRSSVLLFGNLCKLVQNRYFKGLYSSEVLANLLEPHWILDTIPTSQVLKSRWVSDIFSFIGEGNPAQIRKAAANITKVQYNELIQQGCRQLKATMSLVSSQLDDGTSNSDAHSNALRDAYKELEELRDSLPSLTELEAQHAELASSSNDK